MSVTRLNAALLWLAAAAFVYVHWYQWTSVRAGIDFQWHPAHLLASGVDPYQNALNCIRHAADICRPVPKFQWPLYPFFLYVAMLPLGLLDIDSATAVWCAINVVCIVLLALMMVGRMPAVAAALALLALMSDPVTITLRNGQHGLLALALLAAGTRLLRSRPKLAGALLTLSLLKYTLTGPLILFLLLRDYRELNRRSLLLGAGLTLAGTATVFWTLSPVSVLASTAAYLHVVRAGYAVNQYRIDALIGASPMLAGLAVSLLLLIIVWSARHGRRASLQGIAMVCVATLICTPHLIYDAVVIFVPLLHAMSALLEQAGKPPRTTAALAHRLPAMALLLPVILTITAIMGLFVYTLAGYVFDNSPYATQMCATIMPCILLLLLTLGTKPSLTEEG